MKLGSYLIILALMLVPCSATEHLRSKKSASEKAAIRKLSSHPASVKEANDGFLGRKVTLIKNWIANREPSSERSNIGRGLHDINAGLFVFANPDLFDKNDFAGLGELAEESSFQEQKNAFLAKSSDFMKSIEIFETIGTDFGDFDTPGMGKYGPDGVTKTFGGDWDFVLTFLSPILYQYIDRTDLLTNDMRWALLRQGTDDGDVPYSGNSLAYLEANLFFFKFRPIINVRARMIETENHILQIYTWKYLINNYVRYIAQLDPSDERYDPRVAALYANNPDHYNNSPELVDLMLQMTSIILYRDLFETNSKPYEAYSVLPLLILYSYVDKLFPEDENNQKIKTAAQNALDYLAAKFTFQTFEGKRVAPMRRNWSDRNILGFYENDHIPTMFAILSGVNFFPMPSETFYFRREGVTMQTALLDYRLPEEILDYMLDRHDGFWARMQSSYYTDHFHISYDVSLLANKSPPVPDPSPATFFKNDGSIFRSGIFRPLPQVYFGTNDFLNSAGGCGQDFFEFETPLRFLPFEIQKISDLRTIAKPNVLLNRADYRFYDDNVTQLEEDYLVMRGEVDPSKSKNLNTYKSFTFGYLRGKHGSDKYKEWPMTVPLDWQSFLVHSFSINRANFRIYDFSNSAEKHPMHGYYLITAKVSKLPVGRDLRSVARGFWEIVPARMYDSVEALTTSMRQKNPSSFFSRSILLPYKYVLATTGEKIKDARAGGYGAQRCSAIRAIWSPDGRKQYLEKFHFDTLTLRKMEDIGILDVWEIDSNYMIGNKIASAPGDGRLFVTNKHIGSSIEIDCSDYRNPKRQIVPF
jgi:hypothetical protein